MSSKGNAPNRRVAAIQAKKKRKQPKKSKQGEGQNSNKDNRERNRDSKPAPTVEIDKNRSFEEVRICHKINYCFMQPTRKLPAGKILDTVKHKPRH